MPLNWKLTYRREKIYWTVLYGALQLIQIISAVFANYILFGLMKTAITPVR